MAQEQLNALVLPDAQGFFGAHGGKMDHPDLAVALAEIEAGFRSIIGDAAFIAEMKRLQADLCRPPHPRLYHARTLSQRGAQIYLKREDLNHTGAHKINHCIGEVLLAKKLGKRKKSGG